MGEAPESHFLPSFLLVSTSTYTLHFCRFSPTDGFPGTGTSVSVSEPAMGLTPVYVDGESYWYKDWSRLLVHGVSARQHGGKKIRLGAVRISIGQIPGEGEGALGSNYGSRANS